MFHHAFYANEEHANRPASPSTSPPLRPMSPPVIPLSQLQFSPSSQSKRRSHGLRSDHHLKHAERERERQARNIRSFGEGWRSLSGSSNSGIPRIPTPPRLYNGFELAAGETAPLSA